MLALKKYDGDIWDKIYNDLFDVTLWGEERRFSPRTDVVEKKDHFEISVEVPGYTEAELKIELHRGVLAISGARNAESEEKDGADSYLRRERVSSSFERKFILPENADENALEAKLEKGILKLTVAKKQELEPKRIEIK